MTLLIAEDDNLLRSQIVFELEPLFDKIYEVSCKNEAVKIIEQNKIGIILVDLNLKVELDGIEITKKALQQDIKCIVFTANRCSKILKTLIKEGIFDYINKPVDMPTLISSIKRAQLFYSHEKELAKDNIFNISCTIDAKDGIKSSMSLVEKELFEKILKQNDFNVYHTAKILDTKRENIYYFIKKHGLKR